MRRIDWMDGSPLRHYAVCVDVTRSWAGETVVQPQRIASFVTPEHAWLLVDALEDETAAVYRSGRKVKR